MSDGEGQGNLAFCSLWDLKELDTTQQLDNNTYFGLEDFFSVWYDKNYFQRRKIINI